jgi:hypothetical protein
MATKPQIKVAASTLLPCVTRDPQPGVGEGATPGQPFPIDNSRTRWVRPIKPEMLAKIEADARRDAIRAEAIQSMQPGRYETWAMLVIVIGLALFAVMS